MEDFKTYAETIYSGREFPVSENEFDTIFGEFLDSDLGYNTK